MKNRFTNPNVEPWYLWIFRRRDILPALTVYFLSSRNSTSPRFFPLYENSKNYRIIIFRGMKLPYMDRFSLMFLRYFCRVFHKKLSRYKWVSIYDQKAMLKLKTNLILHLDDPEYTVSEKESLLQIAKSQSEKNLRTKLFLTNYFTYEHYRNLSVNIEFIILSQGYNAISDERIISDERTFESDSNHFSVVYSSPYIDYIGDKHEKHTAWSAVHLIDEIIPKLYEKDPKITVRLIGRVGKEAAKKLVVYENVQSLGLVNFRENSKLLMDSSIGIYTRKFDHKRSVQKIFEYAGAGLPIVSYRLVDTSAVEEHGWGILVDTPEQFVEAILFLKENISEFNNFKKRIAKNKKQFSWIELAKQYDLEVLT